MSSQEGEAEHRLELHSWRMMVAALPLRSSPVMFALFSRVSDCERFQFEDELYGEQTSSKSSSFHSLPQISSSFPSGCQRESRREMSGCSVDANIQMVFK